MAHESENSSPLKVVTIIPKSMSELASKQEANSNVWLFIPPFGRRTDDVESKPQLINHLKKFANILAPDALIAILTTPEEAALTWIELSKHLHFQLWVAVKLTRPVSINNYRLKEHHAALLIMSKYSGSLRHTKTRIAYTYCPACDKTTKDYGGKKHTYHKYGTLMSDVWRDISWCPDEKPKEVIQRMSDVFGLNPHQELRVMLLTNIQQLKPTCKSKMLSDSPQKLLKQRECQQHKDSELILGDAIEILKSIETNTIDFCFADPPYNLDKKYDSWDDALDIVDYFKWCDQWLEELGRVLKPERTCAILNIPQWAIRHFSYLRKKLEFQNWIVWEGLSLPVRMIMPAHYSIICFSKGKPRELPGLTRGPNSQTDREALSVLREFYCIRSSCVTNRKIHGMNDIDELTDLWWDIHRLKHNSRRTDHPCQLPPALMERLIAIFSKQNEIILDPFNGAGTTTLCAELLERRFIGIELSEKYHSLAVQRHEFLRRGGDPFAKVKRIPNAKNSRVRRIGNLKYEVPKKVLQLKVRELARDLGRLPTRDEVSRMSGYPIRYFDDYFVSWGEVCAAARTTGMQETRENKVKKKDKLQPTLFEM